MAQIYTFEWAELQWQAMQAGKPVPQDDRAMMLQVYRQVALARGRRCDRAAEDMRMQADGMDDAEEPEAVFRDGKLMVRQPGGGEEPIE